MCTVSIIKNKSIRFAIKDMITKVLSLKVKKIKKNRILVIQQENDEKMTILLEKSAKESHFTLTLCCFKSFEIIYIEYKILCRKEKNIHITQ